MRLRSWSGVTPSYGFSRGPGTLEIIIGVQVRSNFVSHNLGLLGGVLPFLTPFVTLPFLITTPETGVPALGDAQHGFPFLSEYGRLIIKDTVILAGGIVIIADLPKRLLLERASITPTPVRSLLTKQTHSS
ncbi:DUF417 family protein [Paraburkholderia humisilvae]|nr:DUF417 family protein [Paraburkholderia humisilvae]